MVSSPRFELGLLKAGRAVLLALALAACSAGGSKLGKTTGHAGPDNAGATNDVGDAGHGGARNATETDDEATTCDANSGCDPLVACSIAGGKVSCGPCPSGYDDTDGNGTRCEPVDCGALTAPSNGTVETPNGTDYKAAATYSCESGYSLTGEATRSCESSGVWSASEPSCENIDECEGNPCASGDDAEATCEEAAPGAWYTCSCSAGYVASAGAAPVCDDFNACDDNAVCTADYPCQDLPPGAGDYTCRGQFADWTPVDSPNTLSVNANGTVTDSRMGLLWQREAAADRYEWVGAKIYCASLSLAGSGWRLPTQAELLSIVDFTRSEPAISLAAFPNTTNSSFWTSSTGTRADSAGAVAFGDGQVGSANIGRTYDVRCVRSEAPTLASDGGGGAPPGRYTVSDGTVYDKRTRLTWQQSIPLEISGCLYDGCNLAGAIAYCDSLSLAGGGWGLPKISELFTLVDPTNAGPMIDGTIFPGTPNELFWSSSVVINSPRQLWTVDFSLGSNDSYAGSNSFRRVRCVR